MNDGDGSSGTRSVNRSVAGVGALLAAAAVVTFTGPRSGFAQTFGDVAILATALMAVTGCAVAARRGGASARGWWVLTVAAAVWATAQVIWTAYGVTRDHAYPFPSLADIGFLGYAVPAVTALLLFPRPSSRSTSRGRELLDGAVIASSVLFVSWATVLGSLYESDGTGLVRIVGLGYPVVDVLVTSVVLTLAARVAPRDQRQWLLLGGGLVTLTATDSVYASLILDGQTGMTGTPLVLGWMLAFLLIAGASQTRPDETKAAASRNFAVVQELLPVLPLVGAGLVAATRALDGADTFLVANGVVVVVLAVLQQVLAAMTRVRLSGSLEATIERRTAELSSVDARFRSLIESSDDAIFSKSTAGVVTSWNAAAERLFGYTADEIVGRSVDVLIPEHRMAEELEIRRLATTGGAFRRTYETERLHRDGRRIEISLTVSPIYDGGEVDGLSAIARDITEAKARQAELAEARNQALAASTAKSDFLATMSHEIRTPMNGVIGLTGLLLDTPLDESQRRYAEGVRGAGDALLVVIDDILDFSKLEAGQVELESVAFDPRQLVEEIGVLLAESATVKGLELLAYCEPEVPAALEGDPSRLRQVLINLAGNAVKFTSEGEVSIRLAMAAAAPAGRGVAIRFAVSDTGIGIDTDDSARLFDPFSQADASTTRRFGGTGLGLAICHRLVAAMGAEIELESQPGAGSTFSFTLRLPASEVVAPPPVNPQVLAGRRVLVVDDNPTNCLVLSGQLRAWGMCPEVREDAENALSALRRAAADERPFAAALLDHCLPDMDGLALASLIAADPQLAATRTMILTSAGEVGADPAARCGVLAWISKPVRLSELYDRLVSVFDEDSARASVVAPDAAARPIDLERRVLVVEDNRINQMVAQGVLHALGYAVDVAVDGADALRILESDRYDAVLMDCHMPEMDGFEATERLRKREAGGDRTPVIAMTAGVLADDRSRCFAAGMDDFVAKPIEVEHLRQTLARWIALPRSRSDGFVALPLLDLPPTPVPDALDAGRVDLLRRMGSADGWGLLPALADAFTGEAAGDVEALHVAASTGDLPAVRACAHRLRGAAANMGAGQLATACATVEHLARSGQPIDWACVDEVDGQLSRARDALAAILAGRP